jgi:hypothetical protein
VTYQVLDWDKHFENNKSRERDRCGFVCVPNKQDGMGLTRILAQQDGASIYGVWCLIIGALSRQCRPRGGWLTHDGHPGGTPWAPEDMALRWRRPLKEIERALQVLCSEGVGWMVSTECPSGAREVPGKCPGTEQNRREEKRREGKGKAKQKRKSKETYRPPKAVTDIAAAIGVDVGLVVRLVQQGYEEHRLLAWMLKMADGTVKANNPPAYLTAVLKEGKHPREDYVAEAKALLEPPAADLGFGAALSSVPREPGMNQKRNAALEKLDG